MSQSNLAADIRGVLISTGGGKLLLPNASVAEVITFSEPEAIIDAPDWLLGNIRWRGWRLPVLSFAKLADVLSDESSYGAKVAVIKALGGNPKMPYFAVLSIGFPRLVTVAKSNLELTGSGSDVPLGVQVAVQLGEEVAYIPDLLSVELMLAKAIDAAA